MKRVLIIALLIMLAIPSKVDAAEFYRAKATGYCLKGKTASGEILDGTPRNIVASKPEWVGKCSMMVWLDTGDHLPHPENFLGIYDVEDTGSKSIKAGYVIDLYFPTYEECRIFGAPNVIYQVIESEG